MTTQHAPRSPIPAGMVEVTRDEFFATLWAEKRNIHPDTENREYTVWRLVPSRAVWGWSTGGFVYRHSPRIYALAKT